MRAVTVKLKRVFDVIQTGGKRTGVLAFSAELDDGSKLYSIQVPGLVQPQPGMVLTLFVTDPRELRGIVAVRDESTGKLYRERTLTRIVWPFMELVFGSLMLAVLLAAVMPWSAAPLVLVGVGYATWLVVQDRRASAAIGSRASL